MRAGETLNTWVPNKVSYLEWKEQCVKNVPPIKNEPRMKHLKKNRYTYNWMTLLYTWNQHNIVNQLYFKMKLKV